MTIEKLAEQTESKYGFRVFKIEFIKNYTPYWRILVENPELNDPIKGVGDTYEEAEKDLRKNLEEAKAETGGHHMNHPAACPHCGAEYLPQRLCYSCGSQDWSFGLVQSGKCQGSENRNLRKEIAQLRKDKARLDWLENQKSCYWANIQSEPHGDSIFDARPTKDALRSAIDKAMEATKP